MAIGAQLFEACYAELPDTRCSVRVGHDTIARAICTGLDEIKTATDQGGIKGFSGNLRYLSTDEPKEIAAGDVVEVKRAQDAKHIRVRAGVRHEMGGAVRLTISAEFD